MSILFLLGFMFLLLSITINCSYSSSDTRYVLIVSRMSWIDGELYCQQHYHSHLATIISDTETREAHSVIANYEQQTGTSLIWIAIGLADINDGNWIWLNDPTNCDYTIDNVTLNGHCLHDPRWENGEPQNLGIRQHCGAILYHSGFVAYGCDKIEAFLCDYNPNYKDKDSNIIQGLTNLHSILIITAAVIILTCFICFGLLCLCKNNNSTNQKVKKLDSKMKRLCKEVNALDYEEMEELKKLQQPKAHDSIDTHFALDVLDSINGPFGQRSSKSSSQGQSRRALLNELRMIENNDRSVSSNVFEIPLIQEIIRNENEYRKYIKQRPKSSASNQKNSSSGKTQNNNCKNNKNISIKKNKENKGNQSNNDDQDDEEGDDEKKKNSYDNDGIYGMDHIEIILKRVEQLKKHKKYKIMEKQNNGLLNTELIALVYYTDSSSACHKMKSFHRALSNVRKFKELYFHATNGVIKMYHVFHFQNNQQEKINKLYHGSTIKSFDELSQEQVFLKTLFSFSKQFTVASAFATGSIWIIDNVYTALYSGLLKGADVTWISLWQEAEVIILPTTFYNWKQMSKQEIRKQQWVVAKNINIYITEDFISNEDSLCIHGDNVLKNKNRNYKDCKWKDVKYWFMHNLNGLEKEDCVNYFKLFVDNGFHSLELIALINNEQDLLDIGIDLKAHRLKILSELRKVKTSSEIAAIGYPLSDDSETISSNV